MRLVAAEHATGTVQHMDTHHGTQKLLTYDDIAGITGYSVSHLRTMRSQGRFPKTCGPGRKVLVHPHDLELWLQANRKAAA